MNSQFMEFFGNYLIQAARWQKLVEQTSPGKTPGVMDVTDLGKLFNQIFSLNKPAEPASAEFARMWQQAIENFQSAFCLNASLWGWVPQADYQTLQIKCNALEKITQKQDHTISQLRSLLEEKDWGNLSCFNGFSH
jgi:hypothetical protein